MPAAFQYGLWDSNVQDRCRRLELLLMTGAASVDYWHAAAAAAWKRGRGYFGVALLLWGGRDAGRMSPWQVGAGLAGRVAVGLHFTPGLLGLCPGAQANGLGMLLTVGLPCGVRRRSRTTVAGRAVASRDGLRLAAPNRTCSAALGRVAGLGHGLAVRSLAGATATCGPGTTSTRDER